MNPTEPKPIVFAARLRALMAERGLNQEQVAEGADCTQSAVSYYLKGDRSPNLEYLVRLSHFFGITLDDLVFGPINPQPAASHE